MADLLRYHPEQDRLIKSLKNRTKRFTLIQAGRRSGKTDIPAKCFKDLIYQDWLKYGDMLEGGYYYITAPTHTQVRRIWWDRIKRSIPKSWQAKRPLEGRLEMPLVFGCTIVLTGLDQPERIEGPPCFGILSDEWADCKPGIFTKNILTALGDTDGWFIALGVPRPSMLYEETIALCKKNAHEWNYFKWSSEDILPASAIETFKSSMDEITYSIEIKGERTDVHGRVYYSFHEDVHEFEIASDMYSPKEPLILCFDFNVSPGVALILQEKRMDEEDFTGRKFQDSVDVLLAEIWVPVNSNTDIVVGEVINRFGDHTGMIDEYGDASGGADKTSATTGSDWKIISNALNRYYGTEKVRMHIKRANPAVVDRVNATNSKIYNVNKEIGMILDSNLTPKMKRDFEKVQYLDGTVRKIDPRPGGDATLGHIGDAYGYSVEYRYPVIYDKEEEGSGGRIWMGKPPQRRRRR